MAALETHPITAYTVSMIEPAHFPSDDDSAAFLEAVAEGLADANAGRTVPYEDVRRWLLSWGTERETHPQL